MKYSVGQKVKIRSLEWYRDNVNRYGIIECGKYEFFEPMNEYCGKVATIKRIDDDNYRIDTDKGAFCWTDEMIEGLVEEETLIERVDDNGLPFNEWLSHKGAFHVPNGYELKDENGNVINATKIILEKKKREYPKTYEECCKELNIAVRDLDILDNMLDTTEMVYSKNLDRLLNSFRKLLICRDAYWKIAGEEMGLGKPWEPNWTSFEGYPAIYMYRYQITLSVARDVHHRFVFPTEEMRDAFKENFDPDIEFCKEFL